MSHKTRLTTRTLTSTIFSNFSNQKHIPTPTQSHYSYITIIRSTQYPLIALLLSLINRLTRIKLIQPTSPNLPLSAISNRVPIDISYKLHASHGSYLLIILSRVYCLVRIIRFLRWNCECLRICGKFENVKMRVKCVKGKNLQFYIRYKQIQVTYPGTYDRRYIPIDTESYSMLYWQKIH